MKLKDQLEALVAALQAEDPTQFLQLVEDHVGKKEGCNLEELLQAVPRKDVVAVCLGLKHQAQLGIELYSTEAPVLEEGQEGGEEALAAAAQAMQLGVEVLYGVVLLVRLLLAQNKAAPPEALQQAAELLHSMLLVAENYPVLQDEVAKLCLDWWQAEAPGREQLTPQAVPYLLVKALSTGTAADVKRFHSMRGALQLFDFDDPSIGDVKRLLLRAAFAPNFLRCAEGRRTIAYMFNLHQGMVQELTAIIKNQIPSGRKSVLDAYGEIIYRAWDTSTGACQLSVQQDCIQVLMEAAILASSPALAASLRRVLNGLHSQKQHAGVDKMLLELYSPILFRRLNAANPDVRRNALNVFVDAFPLRDPDESNLDTDKRLSDQFANLTALLRDVVPEVRVAALQGVCRILNDYWELIPGTVTASYIKLIAGELAFDTSSPSVRVAVLEGLTMLADNAMAHPLLKVVLPQVKPLLYDSAAKVRTAMVELLLSLSGCEALPWHSITPVEELLEVLAVDVAAVSERIQRLLLPTFFPNTETGPAMVAALLRKTPGAGRAFCQYLVGTYQKEGGEIVATNEGPAVHVSHIVALIRDLRTHLLSTPISAPAAAVAAAAGEGTGAGGKGTKKGRSKRKKAQAAQHGEAAAGAEDDETEQEVSETPESWEAILHGLAALVCGLAAVLAAGRCEEHSAHNLFLSGTLVKLLERCPTAAARRAIMAMGAAFPTLDASQEVRGRCLKHMLAGDYSQQPTAGQADELRGAVECICAADQARDRLLSVLCSSLGGDPSDVLEGIVGCRAEAASAPAEQEPAAQQAKHGKKAAGKKAAAAAEPSAAKKKGRKGAAAAAAQEEEEGEAGDVDDSLACEKCGSRARGAEMLLCDNCDAAYHMGCLDPPLTELPAGDWFCPECDAMMNRGMGKDLAVRVLDLLMQLDSQRALLISSEALARLLACLDLALQQRVDDLKKAIASGAAAPEEEGQLSAAEGMLVYMKGCLHLLLAGQAQGAAASGTASTTLPIQAAECTQQAMDWSLSLLQQLAKLNSKTVLEAIGSTPSAPEAKRSKVNKIKGPAAAASQPGPAAAVKEAFLATHACTVMLGEASRLEALSWASPTPTAPCLVQSACAVAQQALALLGGLAAAATALCGSDAAVDADSVLVAALSHVGRLARNLVACAKEGHCGAKGGATRDLASELQQAEGPAESEQGSVRGGPAASGAAAAPDNAGAALEVLEASVTELLSLGCQDSTSGLMVAAIKPSMAGLLAALCEGSSTGSGGCRGSRWLRPVAQLLGRGIDLEELPALLTAAQTEDQGAEPAEEQAGEGDENAGAAANQQQGEDGAWAGSQQQGGRAGKKGVAEGVAAQLASEHANHPLVKLIVTGAKSAKVQEPLAGCAAEVAVAAFEEGAARTALGALELSTLLGFKGVTARGKSRAGTDSYPAAIRQLRMLKDSVDGLPEGERVEAKALLHHRLNALFPPLPRVTFGAV